MHPHFRLRGRDMVPSTVWSKLGKERRRGPSEKELTDVVQLCRGDSKAQKMGPQKKESGEAVNCR